MISNLVRHGVDICGVRSADLRRRAGRTTYDRLLLLLPAPCDGVCHTYLWLCATPLLHRPELVRPEVRRTIRSERV